MKKSSGNKAPSQRQLRVGELVRHALMQLLQRGEIADPMLDQHMITITEIAMSPDLKIATVYFRVHGDGEANGAANAGLIAKHFGENQKRIRGKLAPMLRQMKFIPQLRFRPDESFDNYMRIEQLLNSPNVRRDLEKPD